MTRFLHGVACAAMVVALPARGAAAVAVSEEVPVPGGTAVLARVLGVEQVPDRGRFVAELTRLVYDTEARNPTAAAFLQDIRLRTRLAMASGSRMIGIAALILRRVDADAESSGATGDGPHDQGPRARDAHELVPLPLTTEIWNEAIFRRRIPADEILVSILADRQAALICHGLAALDDETLQFFAEHSSLLTRLYERSAPAFAVFAGSVRVRANRVVPPGGDAAVPLWEAVVNEKVTRAERFLQSLFDIDAGRVAHLYDIAGHLDAPHRAFVLGSWIPDPVARLERFKELATVGVSSFRDWHMRATPYGRAPYDLGMMLVRVRVTETGAPAPPSSRAFWSRVFGSNDLPDEMSTAPKLVDDEPVDAAWLAEVVGDAEVRQRGERLDQLAFAQRAFASVAAADAKAVLVAVRAVPHYRTLMLSLDRIGVQKPAVFAAAARQANRLNAIDGSRGYNAQGQFQGALALVVRMAVVRTIDARTAESLIERLVAIPLSDDGRFGGALARWVREEVFASRAPGLSMEAAVIDALSGGTAGDARPTYVTWEGQRYRLDLAFAERQRLQRVRDKQEAMPIDVPLELQALAQKLSKGALAAGEIEAGIDRLTKLQNALRRAGPDGGAVDVQDGLRRAIEELRRINHTKDLRRVARAGEPLTEIADELLARALVSFAYAVHIGDPEGTVLLAGDVSPRHDFGFSMKDAALRARSAWAVPRQEVAPGVPWHVSGSLLALEMALAPLSLRRMSFDHLTHAPKLTSNQRDAFAATVAFMNPHALRDEDRDVLVDAVERGRARVLELAKNPSQFDGVADALGLDGWRRRTIRWTIAHEPDRVASMFSGSELLFLGEPAVAPSLDEWGMISLAPSGCLCLRLAPPGRLWVLVGRPQLGIVASAMPDVTLHVASVLKQLGLPAALARVVLSAAVQDFIDEVRPTDDADWMTLARTASMATKEEIEDYLAAATADGPLVPDEGRPSGASEEFR